MKQLTDEWFEAKLGKVGASKIKAVLANGKGGAESKTRNDYMMQLALERVTGRSYSGNFSSKYMDEGIEKEPAARDCYCFETGSDVEQVGWVDHPTIPLCGCSPDGLVGEDGMIEIKSPKITTHLAWIMSGRVPTEHAKQMLWQMEVTGRSWNDFVSYCPELPLEMQLFVKRLERDDDKIKEIREGVIKFLGEVEETVTKLKGLCAA